MRIFASKFLVLKEPRFVDAFSNECVVVSCTQQVARACSPTDVCAREKIRALNCVYLSVHLASSVVNYVCMFQAREEGLSQWEDVLKGQAKEASEGIDNLKERSEAVEAEERRAEEAKAEFEEREKAILSREAELAEMEAGREARAAELEAVRDRLALVEKGLEGQRADLARRRVRQYL